MAYTVSEQRQRIHPYKFNLWIALGSIVMLFGGFTSAYVVMHARDNWIQFVLPGIFWFSTAVIICSSITMHLTVKSFKEHRMGSYKKLITLTAILGLVFMVSQFIGFVDLYGQGIKLTWNVSAALLYVITTTHMLHVLGGVVALLIIFARAYRKHIRSYDPVPVEVAAIYWHFVDILWIYLFLFFQLIR